MDGVNDLRVIDPAQVHGGDGEIGMTELALDDQQRDTLTRHLYRVSMPELVRREASAYTGPSSGSVQLSADAGRCPRMTAGRAAQDAEQCADWKRGAQLQPRAQLLPRRAVHTDFTALAAFRTADQDRP